jgi:hypothetical protein
MMSSRGSVLAICCWFGDMCPQVPLLPPRPPLQVQEKQIFIFCCCGSLCAKKSTRGTGAVGARGAVPTCQSKRRIARSKTYSTPAAVSMTVKGKGRCVSSRTRCFRRARLFVRFLRLQSASFRYSTHRIRRTVGDRPATGRP